MMEKVLTVAFAVESEAYQAFSELKQRAVCDDFVLSAVSLVKKENGVIATKDGFDTGVETADDTAMGGLIGAMVGILGGPFGVLLGASLGATTGSIADFDDAEQNASILERVSGSIPDGQTALLILAQEANAGSLRTVFSKYQTEITEQPAAEVADEVERAQELQRQMARDARRQLREKKRAEGHERLTAKERELKEKFEAFKRAHLSK